MEVGLQAEKHDRSLDCSGRCAHRVAARLLSKGIVEGKARGKLAMDAVRLQLAEMTQEERTLLTTRLTKTEDAFHQVVRSAIGSGLVEGACKPAIGRRLKQTGARWKVRRVERMATLCSVQASDQWDTYWMAA